MNWKKLFRDVLDQWTLDMLRAAENPSQGLKIIRDRYAEWRQARREYHQLKEKLKQQRRR